MAPRTSWKTLYLDLPENVAARLREKRVKPDQLTAKTDGEILALGLSDVDLETIRAKYPIVLPDAAVGAHHDAPSVSISTSHFYKFPRQVYDRSKRYKVLAKKKMTDMNTTNLASAVNMVIGTARSMGVDVK